MQSATTARQTSSNGVGVLLRRWRDIRGKTQLDLSMDAGVTQKHISFVESGRSAPSRRMLLDLAQALDIPLRERNALLAAGGYAAVYADGALVEPAMRFVSAALQRMLRQQEPFPAIVMDRHWNVVLTNKAAPQFFGRFVDLAARPNPRNLLHLMFDPAGMRPFIGNRPEAGRGLLARLFHESLGRIADVDTRRLLHDLLKYPDVDAAWRAPEPQDDLPIIPLSFVKDGLKLSYFSMITTVGAPQSIGAEELRLECMFPADEMTEQEHARFINA